MYIPHCISIFVTCRCSIVVCRQEYRSSTAVYYCWTERATMMTHGARISCVWCRVVSLFMRMIPTGKENTSTRGRPGEAEGEKNIFALLQTFSRGASRMCIKVLQGDELFKSTRTSLGVISTSPDGRIKFTTLPGRENYAQAMSKLRRKQSYSMLKLTSLVEC